MHRYLINALAAGVILCAWNPANAKLPHLAAHGTATQLMVNDKPYLIVGGQVHNSSSGSAEYFDRTVSKLARLHANTVFAPVTWELLEPVEQEPITHLNVVLNWFDELKRLAPTK